MNIYIILLKYYFKNIYISIISIINVINTINYINILKILKQ